MSIPSGDAGEDLQLLGYAFTHDLKASLRPILGFSQYLQGEEVSGDQAGQFHRKIVQAATCLERQMDALAEYTRLCRRAVHEESVELAPLLRAVVTEKLAGLRLGEDCVEWVGRMGLVRADKTIVKLVFRELIDNALVHLPADRAPRLKISCCSVEDRVETTIQDWGLGIPADCLPLLGKPFQRFHGQTDCAQGLGLTRVLRALALVAGRLACSSEVGQGTSFRVSLRAA